MKKIFTILLLLITIQIKAQDTLNNKCWTPEMDTTEFRNLPWYDDNDFLERFLDSIGYPPAGSGYRIVGAPVRFWIPIKFWIYRDDNGNGGPDLRQLRLLMDDLNRRFNQTNNAMIGFYMKCDPTYVNNTTHVTKTFTGASLLMTSNNDHGSINVHVIGSFASNSAGFAIPFLNAAMVPSGSYLDTRSNGDLAHEVGHVLGLQHTHQYSALNWKCLTESVSRTRTWPTFNLCPTRLISNRVCEATGDALRDTQADDNLVSNNSCFYNVTLGNDEWGDSYDNPPAGLQDRPNVRNIMSYNSATDCVDQFSRLQIGVMLWTLYFQKSNNLGGWANSISTFDNYEPDNEPITADPIVLNEVQERNFHQQWNRVGGYAYTTQCDVDWARFVPTCSGSFAVQTSAMTGRTNANTRLTLFDNTGLNQLAQNDDISPSNLFSSVTFNFVAGQTYFIRVENMSVNVTGYYNLSINPQFTIIGNDAFCNSGVYSINNLPAGATVTWGALPAIVNFSPNPGNPTTVTANSGSSGTVTLTANITSSCGNSTVTKQITVGAPLPPSITTFEYDPCGNYVSAGANAVPGAIRYIWNLDYVDYETPAEGLYLEQGVEPYPYFHLNAGQHFLRLQVENACGISGYSPSRVFTTQDCGGQMLLLSVSPNPSNSTTEVTLSEKADKTKKKDIYEIRIIDKMGNIKQTIKYSKGSQTVVLDVAILPFNIYTIQAFDGKAWFAAKFSKN